MHRQWAIAQPLTLAFALALAGTSSILLPTRQAQAQAPEALTFSLPAQDLSLSLRSIARQAKVDIIFAPDDVAGRRAPALVGNYTLEAAVTVLLAGTPLRAEMLPSGAISVNRAAQSSALSGSRHQVDPIAPEEIIVTARAGVDTRRKAEASYAITTIPQEELRMRGVSSVAEVLKSVPGFWVEASGGEASANVRARGIPVDGFGSIAIDEDGLPIQHDPALGYLNADQAFRLDETIERVEVVRGGPSSIFTSNAPGGVVNFITRKGGNQPGGLVKYQIGDDGLHRLDAWYGGPIGDWRLGLGGFYRIEDGIRDPGFHANDGGQIRASIGRDFEDGRIDFNIKHLDDRVDFYTGIPLTFDDKRNLAGVPGFDPNYATMTGPETAHLNLRTATGNFPLNLTDGTHVDLTQISMHFEYQIFDGWKLENGLRYRDSDSARNGLFPAAVATGAARLAAAKSALLAANPGATAVQLRYVDSPSTIFDLANQNGNGLVVDAGLRSVSVPEREFVDDLRLVHKLEIAGQTHDVALGAYVADIDESFRRYSATGLIDVENRGRLLNLVAVNAAGQVVGYGSENGITRYGSEFANGSGQSTTVAFYASDEWQATDQLRIDGGARWERVNATGSVERRTSVNLGVSPTPADRNILTGSGVFDPFDRQFSHLAWTLGVNWQFDPYTGLFARYTSTFRLPSVGDFITNATATPVIQKIRMGEVGYKLSMPFADLYATAFDTEYKSFGIVDLIYNPATGGFDSRTTYSNTNTYGVELEGIVRPVDWFDMAFDATVQQPEFDDLRFTELVAGKPVLRNYSGNQLLRVPRISFRVTPAVNLLDGRLRLAFDIEHYSGRYADAANSQRLPAFTVLNADLRFDVTPQLSFYFNANNLTNEIGLTEGNPRAGQLQSGEAGALYYLARPILGRNFRAAALYRF